jgi:hypothetical protein
MASRDLYNLVLTKVALNTQAITTNTTTNGVIIDTLGFESVTFAIQSGTITDGTYTPTIFESDDSGLSGSNAVDSSFLIPTDGTALSGAVFSGAADSNKSKRFGYVGHKRYVRISEASTGVTSGGTFSAQVILSNAKSEPTAGNS